MEKKQLSGYELSRQWFDFSFENSEKINPNHTALYFFIIEHSNRLGWKPIFGLPSSLAMEAIGIKSYNTYIKTLNELIGFGFIKMIEKSKNQYTANIIALSNINKALDKALDKALIKHSTKQSSSTVQSIDSIIKQINKETNNQETKKQKGSASTSLDSNDFINSCFNACKSIWFKHHPEWQFTGKDGKGLKLIIEQLNAWQKDSDKEITPETTAAAFDYMLSHSVVTGSTFLSTADPLTLASKLNSIYEQLKNFKNGTTNNNRKSSYDPFQSFYSS
ncbi:hypothetical protein ABDK00_013190 [Niabella insulamsoli]|uniref:hypothetical protein n=1 Tax=Niabella insulamsoli TaxID=3144874 RepID=UPI0031FDFE9C